MSKEFITGYVLVDGMMRQGQAIDQGNQIQGLKNDLERARRAGQTIGLPVTTDRNQKAQLDEMAEKLKFYQEREAIFVEKYKAQEELMANWIVSQKAFKETAQKLGTMLGKSPEEVAKEGLDTKEKILNNQSEFGNNIDIEDELREKLKNKIKK